MIVLRFGVVPCAGILLAAFQTLSAQAPEVGRNGVFNSASNVPPSLSNNEIARGALLTVTGVGLGSKPAGTVVRIGDTPLTLIAVLPERIDARVPLNAPLGPASLSVTVEGKSSRLVPVRVVPAQVGLFSSNGTGGGPGRIENVSPIGTHAPNSTTQSAAPGQTIMLAGTGLGNATAPSVWVGGKRAILVSVHKNLSGSAADQIAIRIPADAPEGCFVPVQIRNAGRLPSNMVTVSIRHGGGPCDPMESIPFAAWAGSRFGFVAAARTSSRRLGSKSFTTSDEGGGTFATVPAVDDLTVFFRPPPPGTCISHVEAAGDSIPGANPFLDLLLIGGSQGPLSAGMELPINDGQMQQKIRPVQGAPGVYYSKFSVLGPGGPSRVLTHFMAPDHLTFSGANGPVGAFRVSITGPEAFTLKSPIAELERSRGTELRWEGLGSDRFAIAVVLFTDPVTFTVGSCYCVAPAGASSLTIPPDALAGFPALAPVYGGGQSFLTLLSWPVHPVPFIAPGLDHGIGISTFLHSWEVTLR